MGVDAGARRVGGVDFFDDGGFNECGLAGGGEEFTDLGEREVDDLSARFVDERFLGTYHQFDVASGGHAIGGL